MSKITRTEMIAKMREAGCDGASKLNMRSEANQKKTSAKKFGRLKKSLKKKSKLLLVTELAIPFNPETGIEDENFNLLRKYRPPFSAITVALTLKELANENEKTKETFMKRAGVESWDTSKVNTFTEEDWSIFSKYRVPRIFTVPVVTMSIPAMNKYGYSMNFSIDVKRDVITGDIDGEWPGVLKVNKFFRDKLYEEISELEQQVKDGIKKISDKELQEQKSDIYKKNPVSSDHPANFVQLIELPLAMNYQISSDFDISTVDKAGIDVVTVYSNYGKGIRLAVEKYASGEWGKFDKNFNYFEIDMCCPITGDDQSDSGKREIGQDTTFEKPQECIYELSASLNETLNTAIVEYLDDNINVEDVMLRSIHIKPYTEAVEQQMYTALETVIDIDSDKYITDNVLLVNAEVITLIFGERGDTMLLEAEEGVSDRSEGCLDESGSEVAAKSYDLNSNDFADDLEVIDN